MNEQQNNNTAPRKRKRKPDPRRRRMWQSLRLSALTIVVIVPVFFVMVLYNLVLPRSTVSTVENRNLATFPKFTLSSYFSGEFTDGVKTWYDDTVPFRDTMKNASYTLQGLFGFSTEDSVTYVPMDMDLEGGAVNQDSSEESSAAETTSTEETQAETSPVVSEEPDQEDFTKEEAENELVNGLLIVKQNGHYRCLVLYGSLSGDAYVEALDYLQEQVGDEVSIYNMPTPTSVQYYLPSNADVTCSDEEESMQEIADKMDPGITFVNAFPVLAKHTEEATFLRTDHHWAPLGAYYAARTFAEAADVPFADISTYTEDVAEGYVGTLYSFSSDARLLNDPEDFVTYIPSASYETDYYDSSFDYSYSGDLILGLGNYLTFMGTDDCICKVTTEVNNGRKLLIVKDSYGNAEVPFYTSSFQEIYVTDMRYLQCNLITLIKTCGITDVLFTMCPHSVVGSNADNLMTIMTQNADETLVDNGPNADSSSSADTADGETADTAETGDTAESGETASVPASDATMQSYVPAGVLVAGLRT